MIELYCVVAACVGYCIGRAIECGHWVKASRKGKANIVVTLGAMYWVNDDQLPCARCGCEVLRPECFCRKVKFT